ncbi:MAG: hypothetical protein KBG98_13300, partial [Desulfobacter sp.]|uniref:hypothetical protein n=1 Tax=Desulfobacter sp. TaxID=2294 RepID=UPI001B53C63D
IFLCSLGQFCWPLPGHLFWPLTQDLVFTKEDGNPVPKYYIQRYSHIDNEMEELAMGTLSSFLGIRNSCFESA